MPLRGPRARPVGAEKVAAAAAPSALPATPVPASVLTTGWGASVTARRRCPPVSAMYSTAPSLRTAMPAGELKVAMGPAPLAAPRAPDPARVATLPPASMRTWWLPEATKYRAAPLGLKAQAAGALRVALAGAGPSREPGTPVPARVDTTLPFSASARNLCPPVSAITSCAPEGLRQVPAGAEKVAAVPAPSAAPAAALTLPASTLTAPPASCCTALEALPTMSTAPPGVAARPAG
jgi:hypothetical protein